MRITRQQSNIIFIVLFTILLLLSRFLFKQQFSVNSHHGEVIILAKNRLCGSTNFNAIVWQFKTDDNNAIEKNKVIAEKILLDVITQAEQANVDTIVIQAVKRKSFLIFNHDIRYGYVWEQGLDGQWYFIANDVAGWYATDGETFRKQQQYQQAIDAFSKSLKFSPRQTMILISRGFSYAQLHQFNNAIQDFSLALAIASNNGKMTSAECGKIYYLRGLTYYDMHRDRQSIGDLQAFLSLLPADARVPIRQYAMANNDIAWSMATSPYCRA